MRDVRITDDGACADVESPPLPASLDPEQPNAELESGEARTGAVGADTAGGEVVPVSSSEPELKPGLAPGPAPEPETAPAPDETIGSFLELEPSCTTPEPEPGPDEVKGSHLRLEPSGTESGEPCARLTDGS